MYPFMIDDVLTEDVERAAADAKHAEMKKKNPNANYSVIKGKKSGKWHVVHHTSGGMRMVEDFQKENPVESFEEFLTEGSFGGEYHHVLKKHGFTKSNGGKHTHPEHGIVTINQHGSWKHVHPKTENHEGTTGHSLDKHLQSLN